MSVSSLQPIKNVSALGLQPVSETWRNETPLNLQSSSYFSHWNCSMCGMSIQHNMTRPFWMFPRIHLRYDLNLNVDRIERTPDLELDQS
jgi:hypothetical protein